MDKNMIATELLAVAKEFVGGGWGRFSEDLSDTIEAQVMMNKHKSVGEIIRIIKEQGLGDMMKEENMSDRELKKMVVETLKFMV